MTGKVVVTEESAERRPRKLRSRVIVKPVLISWLLSFCGLILNKRFGQGSLLSFTSCPGLVLFD